MAVSCADMCRMILAPSVRFTHIVNEGKRGIVAAALAKKMGQLAGITDLWFGWPVGMSGWIELKRPASPGKRAGYLSGPQEEFRDWCFGSGHLWMECHSIQEVYSTLKGWKVPMKGEGFHAGFNRH